MKKRLMAMAVGATVLAPCAALAEVKVYGKFNVGLDRQKDEVGIDSGFTGTCSTESCWKLRDNNNSSRLGFKGSEELGMGDLKALYQLEYGIDPDGTEGAPFSERNIFVGLTGGFGTVRAGKYDTSVKEIGGNVDQFNDTIGDITNIMVGETRANNLIQYTTPKLGDAFQLSATVQPGEHRQATDDAAATSTEKGLADTIYLAATYGSPTFDAGLAYANNEVAGLKFDSVAGFGSDAAHATTGIDILRATAQFRMSGLELGALIQTATGIDQTGGATQGSDAKETSLLASVGYTLDAFKLKGQYGRTEGDFTEDTRDEVALGVDYKLSKSAVTQVYYVKQTHEDGAAAPAGDLKTDTLGFALVYSF